jgi:hypothetical protein
MSEPKTMPMSNPANYVARLEPFESREEACATAEAFFADLYALCTKHGIPDLSFIWTATVKDASKDGGLNSHLQLGAIGDPDNDLNLRLAALEVTLRDGDEPDEAHQALASAVQEAVESAGVLSPRQFRWDFPNIRAMCREMGLMLAANEEAAAEKVEEAS